MEKFTISNEVLEKLIELADELEIEYEMFYGNLLDEYVFYDTEKIKFKGIKPAKYLIVRERPLNVWTSELELIPTDDTSVVNEHMKTLYNGEGDEEVC